MTIASRPARTDRAEFAVTTLPNGNTRMYVGAGDQTDSGANRASLLSHRRCLGRRRRSPTFDGSQNIGYCTGQCWYDNVVYTPPGASWRRLSRRDPSTYGELHGRSNGRAWLLSTDAGATSAT